MKKFATLALALASTQALASSAYKLPETATSLTPIAGEVVEVRSLCQAGTVCKADGTVVTLRFKLLGCLDELAPVTHEAIEKDGKLHVYVSAQNVHTRDSMSVFCYAAPEKLEQISLISKYGEVEVHYLGASKN